MFFESDVEFVGEADDGLRRMPNSVFDFDLFACSKCITQLVVELALGSTCWYFFGYLLEDIVFIFA